jgi:hypothetical protein
VRLALRRRSFGLDRRRHVGSTRWAASSGISAPAFLVPYIGSRAIFYLLGALTIACAAGLFALHRGRARRRAAVLALVARFYTRNPVRCKRRSQSWRPTA